MARKVGQIVRRGSRTWLVRVYTGRDFETKKRTYLKRDRPRRTARRFRVSQQNAR